jgi:phospholipid/cholesterol/gamma-HCH transport system ATP-binding protein
MIKIRDLRKSLQKKEVLKGVNLDVTPGEILVILGRSGCGKSVLLKHIAGLFKPDTGSILVKGIEITALDHLEFIHKGIRIAILFQNSALFDSLNVRENVGFYIDRYSGLPEPERDRLVAGKLKLVDLEGIEQYRPFQLSGGMQKRVALARSLIMDPDLMLYDEPTTGLDPITADAINDLIIDLNKRLKITSLIVTHDLASAFKVAHRMAFLNDGVIAVEGTPDEVKASSDETLQRFLNGSYQENTVNLSATSKRRFTPWV